MLEVRPAVVAADGEWQLMMRRFNGVAIALYRAVGDVSQIRGWVDNPRIELALRRWRRREHRSGDSFPDDQEMLEIMLEDDELSRRAEKATFAIVDLGEDIKRNGVREEIIVTWDGRLLDGNRRKFAVMWALSDRGVADAAQRQMLGSVPMGVLPE